MGARKLPKADIPGNRCGAELSPRTCLLSHYLRPQEVIQKAISQIIWRDAETSKVDEPSFHAGRAQKQCRIFSDLIPKCRVDHHKVTVDGPTLLASVVAKIPIPRITEPDTDTAGFVAAFDRIPKIDHPLPPSDLLMRSGWRTARKQILNGETSRWTGS